MRTRPNTIFKLLAAAALTAPLTALPISAPASAEEAVPSSDAEALAVAEFADPPIDAETVDAEAVDPEPVDIEPVDTDTVGPEPADNGDDEPSDAAARGPASSAPPTQTPSAETQDDTRAMTSTVLEGFDEASWGDTIDWKATVTSDTPGVVPTGSVLALVNGEAFATEPLVDADPQGGAASTEYFPTRLDGTPGLYTIGIIYDGDANVQGSQTERELLLIGGVDTALSVSAERPQAGQPFAITATAYPREADAAWVPTGQIRFAATDPANGYRELGVVTLDAAGAATLDDVRLPAGFTTLTAFYEPDARWFEGAPGNLDITVSEEDHAEPGDDDDAPGGGSGGNGTTGTGTNSETGTSASTSRTSDAASAPAGPAKLAATGWDGSGWLGLSAAVILAGAALLFHSRSRTAR